MAKKPEKLYSVHAELHRISDVYGDQLIESHDLERIGVSEKQVISRLRYTMNWYDTDSYDGSVSFEWRFILNVKDLIVIQEILYINKLVYLTII